MEDFDNKEDNKVEHSFLNGVKSGKKLMEAVQENVTNKYLIDGKSAADWSTYFKVSIPKHATTEDIKKCAATLAEHVNTASFYRANAQLISDVIEQGSRDEYLTLFEQKVKEYSTGDKKLPAQKTLEGLAENSMKEINGAKANAQMKQRFWKNIFEGLVEERKLLEQVLWSINIETRMDVNR